MTRDDFAGLVGDKIAHHTYSENLSSIMKNGLLAAASLASAAGVTPDAIALRSESRRLGADGQTARLNHQRPLIAGRNHDFLDGHSLEGWARQLDARIFFLPSPRGTGESAFARSLGGEIACLTLSSRAFFDAFAPEIWLSPINSGSATRRPSRRGDWLYVDVAQTAEDFRMNRVRRELVAGKDGVKEISIRRDIPPTLLERLLIG